MPTISFDMEWTHEGIDTLGLAWDEGLRTTATHRTNETMAQFLGVLHAADTIAGQNVINADLRQLERENIDTSMLLPKCFDIRLAMHAVNGHLAGTGSFDLRSIVLLLNGRQGMRYPLDFKQYASDLHRTCAMDAGAVSWCVPTLQRMIVAYGLAPTVEIAHRCAPIFARMHEQGVQLDTAVLRQLYDERKVKLANSIEKFGLWEERGRKVVKRVPIWRSPKVLELFESRFGYRPANLQRTTWAKLLLRADLSPEAREFAQAVVELGKGANDAHWLGKVTEGPGDGDGLHFDKVSLDGKIFPRYDICGSPDRAIASGPNVQNFVRVSDDPRPVPLRSAVIPLHPDHVLIGIDYSNIETITNAYESGDTDRVNAVLTKRLTHDSTQAMLNKTFKLSLTRTQAKICSHAGDKGESPYNLARRLFNTERPSRQQVLQCQQIFTRMLADYPVLAKFRDQLWERAQENPLVVTNSFGRRLMCFSRSRYGDANERFAKHDPSKKYWCSCSACSPRRDRFKYAVAFLGRSCAFDALLRTMAKVWYDRRMDEYSLPYLEVHDSLTFSVPRESASKYLAVGIEAFQEPIPEIGGISLPCEGSIGQNWAECK